MVLDGMVISGCQPFSQMASYNTFKSNQIRMGEGYSWPDLIPPLIEKEEFKNRIEVEIVALNSAYKTQSGLNWQARG